MGWRVRVTLLLLAVLAISAPELHAQQKRSTHLGYVFPAGGQRGAAFECVVGGELLDNVQSLYVSRSGVRATAFTYDRPLPQKRFNELREYLEEARKKAMEFKTFPPGDMQRLKSPALAATMLKESGATDEEIARFFKLRKERSDPKRQQNQQIAETVTLKMEIASDAPTGPRELRVMTPSGLSNALSFCVGALPEPRCDGTQGATVNTAARVSLPAVLNGQILPGQINHYSFEAKKGAHLVIATQGRDLIPYLADAVPGWFQPVVVLYDAKGKEVAYAGDYRFSPDPVLCYDVPENGVYLLEIKDALYRGREDFVYRVTVGEIPFITSIFPLGGRANTANVVDLVGWNLTRKRTVLDPVSEEGIRPVPQLGNGLITGNTLFAVDDLPVRPEQEANNKAKEAQEVKLPVIINGQINPSGDVDVYAFSCRAGAKIVAEVQARRLNSPLDSWLKATDSTGRQLAFNDEWDDAGAGLLTHQADSYLTFQAPTSGLYYLYIGDAEKKGGPEFAYRLRISPPRPDFALRIAPSCINAAPGATVPVTVYALRRDGFSGDIALALKEAPAGMILSGGIVGAGQEKVRATVTLPQVQPLQPLRFSLEGRATVEGRELSRQAIPVDDTTQAFLIHHLVPARELLAVVTGTNRGRAPIRVVGQQPIKLPASGTGQVVISNEFRQPPFNSKEYKFQLSEPPDGISIQGSSKTSEGQAISFQIDGAKIKPGARGNLIIEAIGENTSTGKEGKPAQKNRWSAGFLPAIPFEVTGP